eukprot:8187048-Alexandrium_andersonii.AAC.1
MTRGRIAMSCFRISNSKWPRLSPKPLWTPASDHDWQLAPKMCTSGTVMLLGSRWCKSQKTAVLSWSKYSATSACA